MEQTVTARFALFIYGRETGKSEIKVRKKSEQLRPPLPCQSNIMSSTVTKVYPCSVSSSITLRAAVTVVS